MDHFTTLEQQLAAPAAAMAQTDLATRHQHGVSNLLAHRGDQSGVYAFADVVEESVRWSA